MDTDVLSCLAAFVKFVGFGFNYTNLHKDLPMARHPEPERSDESKPVLSDAAGGVEGDADGRNILRASTRAEEARLSMT